MSWSLFSWELSCLLSVKVLLQRAQAETPHQRKAGCEAPEKASKPRDLFFNYLPPLQSWSSQCQHPCSLSYCYYIHFHSSNSQSICETFRCISRSSLQHCLRRDKLQAKQRNPNYHPWWKARREKMISRKSGTLQGWQESDLVQPPTEKQLQYCWSPLNVLSLHIRSTPPSLTPAFIRDKAPCSRPLISLAAQRSISPGRLLPRISLISKFAVT